MAQREKDLAAIKDLIFNLHTEEEIDCMLFGILAIKAGATAEEAYRMWKARQGE